MGIITLWVVVLARSPSSLRNKVQRPLWLAVAATTIAMSMHLEPVTFFLTRTGAAASTIDITKHLLSIVDAAAVLWFILGAAQKRRHTALVFVAAACIMVTLVTIYLSGPAVRRIEILPSSNGPAIPIAYWWVFLTFHLIADSTCGLVCWTYGRRDAPPLLRYGLRLFGAGMLLASTLWILKFVYLYTETPGVITLYSPVTGLEALCIAMGVVLPFLPHLLTGWRLRRKFHDLEPLWRELTTSTPDVVLGPAERRHIRKVPRQLRLYRRVIEIRDAMIVLRNYVSLSDLDLARRHVSDHDVPEHLAEAHVTACWLTAALHSRNSGRLPQAQTTNLAGPGANEFSDEITHLFRIATAFRSPVIDAYKKLLSHRM
ncbi:MAB_1171c family putative transporter [Streptomyces sp. GMR22]|uniref:MAB_1171c family putative transporter n=1 Tax=Streptomyces sp. GMR22 TaxID=2759524 RepID=UPI001F264AE3|nr:MAB_1171c family putative transporter [Streptomyces sp. GMR22]